MTTIFQFRLNQVKNNRERQLLERQFKRWEIDQHQPIRLTSQEIEQIIALKGLDSPEAGAKILVEWADKLGAIFKATGLTSSQIRNFFGVIRSIQQQGFSKSQQKRQFILLLPKIEYAAARANKLGMNGFRDVLKASIEAVGQDADNFQRFIEFFEAILAYHRAYGGK